MANAAPATTREDPCESTAEEQQRPRLGNRRVTVVTPPEYCGASALPVKRIEASAAFAGRKHGTAEDD